MIFNSVVFFEFAILFFFGWHFLRQVPQVKYYFLIGASLLFYGYAGWWFVPLLIGTATVDFYLAAAIYNRPDRKKLFLILSLVSNLTMLGTFKYLAFATNTINGGFHAIGLEWTLPVYRFILPVGISFYTFQSLSYIFDVYNGKLVPTKSLTHFLAIVSLFAHLVAGPIVRVSHILPQIEKLEKPTSQMVWEGTELIIVGFFKKVVLADQLAPYVDRIYAMPPGAATPGQQFLATLAFAFQIYNDFSGYTDIARGLAKWMGLEFTLNFNHPYTAVGMGDFWARWHISLSQWIRDYVYIPLGGSRNGELQTHRNLWISMLLSGLWHGANFTFIVWGGLHAFYSSLERITKWSTWAKRGFIPAAISALFTFTLVCIAWVFFRAETIHQALSIVGALPRFWVGLPAAAKGAGLPVLIALMAAIIWEIGAFCKNHLPKVTWPSTSLGSAVRMGAMVALCIFFPGPGHTFIYFQF